MIRKAVLLIHGFVGGTYDLEYIQNHLELNRRFDTFSYTLPGHERILSKVEYPDWINRSEEMVKWLIDNGYREIYLVSHSMGGVIASYLASKYKEIKKVVLAAPSFNYLSVVKDSIHLKDSIKSSTKVLKTYSSKEILSRILKLNVSATREFMKLVSKYYDTPKEITCPVLLLQGTKDDLVPISSSEYVYNSVKSKVKKMVIVEGVTHDIFRNERVNEIYSVIEKFLRYPIIEGGISKIWV